jgi:hypothetical protein
VTLPVGQALHHLAAAGESPREVVARRKEMGKAARRRR